MRENTRQDKLDLHVIPAWNNNKTGRGIVITVLDDGRWELHLRQSVSVKY